MIRRNSFEIKIWLITMGFLALWFTRAQAAVPADLQLESPVDGSVFKLAEHRGQFVALHFLLKTECPYCLRLTQDYAKKSANLPGVSHVFIKPDSADAIRSWSAEVMKGEGVPAVKIYRDPDAMWAARLGVPDGYAFHGERVHYPALILVDREGKEVFRYIGTNNTDRFTFERFAAQFAALSAPPASIAHYNLGSDKLALSGYDPVAYFTDNKPLKGRKELTTTFQGVRYQFGTEEHLKLFQAEPVKYLPTYGGWCATAMAKGEKVEIDPTNFKVTQGRLFLFFKAFYANAIKDWNKDEPGMTVKADTNWKRISGE